MTYPDLSVTLLYADDSLAAKHMQQNKHGKGSSLGLVGKAYCMTLALLQVGACTKAWCGDGTNYMYVAS